MTRFRAGVHSTEREDPVDSPDLAAFLLARIEEDERMARDAIRAHEPTVERFVSSRPDDMERMEGETAADWEGGTNEDGGGNFWCGVWAGEGIASICVMDSEQDRVTAEYIAHWDPARVLADCAAKRAVAEVLAKQAAACPPDDWPEDGEIMKAPLADNARHLLRRLVQPYSGHPHFHPSWANTNSEA